MANTLGPCPSVASTGHDLRALRSDVAEQDKGLWTNGGLLRDELSKDAQFMASSGDLDSVVCTTRTNRLPPIHDSQERTMSTNSRIRKTLWSLTLAASSVALTATTASADPSDGLPFDVSIRADAVVDGFCAPEVPHQLLSGTGHATHMGRIAVTGEACVGGDGVANWIAANGDTITIEFTTIVTGPPNPDGSIPVAFPALDVSGTGRFANVVLGPAPLQANVYFLPDGNAYLDAWVNTTISYDASDRSDH
jgi:hypothetical protein